MQSAVGRRAGETAKVGQAGGLRSQALLERLWEFLNLWGPQFPTSERLWGLNELLSGKAWEQCLAFTGRGEGEGLLTLRQWRTCAGGDGLLFWVTTFHHPKSKVTTGLKWRLRWLICICWRHSKAAWCWTLTVTTCTWGSLCRGHSAQREARGPVTCTTYHCSFQQLSALGFEFGR